MKVATFNINNINKRLPNLLAWLKASKPGVVCLQELKTIDEGFPATELQAAGYGAVGTAGMGWRSSPGRRDPFS